MKIRSCTPEDLTSIREIFNETIRNTTFVYEYDEFTEDYIKQWYEEKCVNNYPVLIAEENELVAGFCTYGLFRNRCANRSTMEHSIYVHPDFRRRGLGRLLLQTIEKEAAQNGVHLLVGVIDSQNIHSIALHHSEGFTTGGRIPEVGFKFGQWLEVVFLYKILNSKELV